MIDSTKKAYVAPSLVSWGSVVALTQVGLTRPGNDCFGGSVNPPGHADGCPPSAD